MTLSRRSFFTGLAAAIAAPAVVRASSIMPVKPIPWRVVTAADWAGSIGEWRGFPWADYTRPMDDVLRMVVREFDTREEAERAGRALAAVEAAAYGAGTSFFDEAGHTITVGQISDMADLFRPHETILLTCSVGDSRRGKGRGRI